MPTMCLLYEIDRTKCVHQCCAMAGKGNYHIDWDDFTTTSSERFQNLVGKKEFSDVTLVSDDGTRIPSHQAILASGCTFFKKLLVEEMSKNPLIFMRGVEASLLDRVEKCSGYKNGTQFPPFFLAESKEKNSKSGITLRKLGFWNFLKSPNERP